jgi:transcriptional regulator with XRE-family HTH domain
MSAFGNELTRLMAARGIGVHEFARVSHYSAGYISNLRSGKKTPAPETAAEFDALLQANGQLIATLSTSDAGAPDGRSFLDGLTNHAIELGKWAGAGNVGDGTVEQLDDAIQRIARDHLSSPLEPLIRRASDISHCILEFLREHQRLRHTRDLYLIGAKVNAFLAAACGDLGQQAAAAAHARTALILAQEAGHPGAVAIALSALSKVAFWDGRKRRAADLARHGYELCPPNSTRVPLACQEADAADVPQAREATSRAVRAYGERSCDDDLPGLFSCGIARRSCYTMTLHLRAGQPVRVLAVAAEADEAYRAGEERSYGTWAQVQMSAALTLVWGLPTVPLKDWPRCSRSPRRCG